MGKGDQRTRRGKIFRGTYGKTRPKAKKIRREKKAALHQARTAGSSAAEAAASALQSTDEAG
jgi:30S ribosomal protein S31